MYNRYIAQGTDYAPIPPQAEAPASPSPRPKGLGGLLGGLLRPDGGSGTTGKVSQALSSLLSSVGLKELDTGDILLALVVLFLILEDGDDLELLIALGLTILLNLGEP